MAQRTGSPLTAPAIIQDDTIPLPSHYANLTEGGHHSYPTIGNSGVELSRNGIKTWHRRWGMHCDVYNDPNPLNNGTYKLKYKKVDTNISNNDNWELASAANTDIDEELLTYDPLKEYNNSGNLDESFAVEAGLFYQYINVTPAIGVAVSDVAYWLQVAKEDIQGSFDGGDITLNPVNNKYYVSRFGAISLVTSGTDNYTVSTDTPMYSYKHSQVFFLKVVNTNTGACTINITSGGIALGVKAIKHRNGNDLSAGDLIGMSIIGYNGTYFELLGASSQNTDIANRTLGNLTDKTAARQNLGFLRESAPLTTGATVTWNFGVGPAYNPEQGKTLLDPPTTDFTIAINDTLNGATGTLLIKKTTASEQIVYLTSNNGSVDYNNQDILTALVLPSGAIGDECTFAFMQFGTWRKWITSDGNVVQVLSNSPTEIPSAYAVKSVTDFKHGQGGNGYGVRFVAGTTDNQDVSIVRNGATAYRLSVLATSIDVIGTTTTGTASFRLINSGASTKFEVYDNGNLAVGAVGSFGGGVNGFIFVANYTTASTTSPVGGALILANAGRIQFKFSDGTVATAGIIPDLIPALTAIGNGTGISGPPVPMPLEDLAHDDTDFIAVTIFGNPDVAQRGPWSQIGNVTATSIDGTTARISLFGTGATWSSRLRKAYTLRVGQQHEFFMHGVLTFNNTGETLEIRHIFTNTPQGTVVAATSGAFGGGAVANKNFMLRVTCTIKTEGAAGTMDVQGVMLFQGPTGNAQFVSMPNLADVTINTTVDNLFDIDAQWIATDTSSYIKSTTSKDNVNG